MELSRASELLSIVIPAYDEEQVLLEFHRRLSKVLAKIPFEAEILYVNDGSTDQTMRILQSIRASDNRVGIIDLSRNFGKEIALTAGIDHASGRAVIVIDADLQDPPELIPDLVHCWQDEQIDVVYAQRIARDGETWLKKTTARWFYSLMRRLGHVELPPDTGDFRLLSRRAVDALCTLREHHRFMKGLFAWVGFSQKAVPYRRESRLAGRTKWSYWGLWNLAVEGVTSFTGVPLRIASFLGISAALGAFLYAGVIVYKTFLFGEPVAGFPTLMVTVLFLGGVQLVAIGVIGEYLGRVFNETKRRPLYFLNEYLKPVDVACKRNPAHDSQESPTST